jgi:hypothetical protein
LHFTRIGVSSDLAGHISKEEQVRDIVFIRLCKPDCIIMGFVYVTPENQICQWNSWTLVNVDADEQLDWPKRVFIISLNIYDIRSLTCDP